MFRRFIIISIFFPNILFSQIQNTSYNSLNLNSSSRVLAMGGELIAVPDNDLSLVFQAPSLLNESMNKQIAFNFVDYVSDLNFLSCHSANKISDDWMLFLGIDAINYGKFQGTDEMGSSISEFSASQQIFTFGTS